MILFHTYKRNIVLVILIPSDSQQRLIGLEQYIAFTLIPRIKLPCATISTNCSKNIRIRRKAYIEHFLIMRYKLFNCGAFLYVPDAAGCVQRRRAYYVQEMRVPIKGSLRR